MEPKKPTEVLIGACCLYSAMRCSGFITFRLENVIWAFIIIHYINWRVWIHLIIDWQVGSIVVCAALHEQARYSYGFNLYGGCGWFHAFVVSGALRN